MGRLEITFQFLNLAELGVPVAVLMILVALIVPVPGWLLDLLIVIDIMTSLVVMMVSVYITRPVDFSVFPTTLLLLTLLRLSLNISATRLILSNGNYAEPARPGPSSKRSETSWWAAAFVIGVIIFLTLIAIQYVVINHGAVRISEVTARFTLDSLPGKQMSIDSDLSSGIINEKEARERRKMLSVRVRLLWRHGWRDAVHPARRYRQYSDHRHQHRRRIPDRRFPARNASVESARNLYRAHHR